MTSRLSLALTYIGIVLILFSIRWMIKNYQYKRELEDKKRLDGTSLFAVGVSSFMRGIDRVIIVGADNSTEAIAKAIAEVGAREISNAAVTKITEKELTKAINTND